MITRSFDQLCSVLRTALQPKMSHSGLTLTVAATVLAALFLGGLPAAAQSSNVSYAYSANNDSIESFKVDPATGRFAPLSYVSLGDNTVFATSVAILRSPTATFLYVATNSSTKALTGYSVNLANGVLTAVNSVPLTSNPNAVVVDPTNSYVYVAQGSGIITSFQTDINGSLTALGTTNTGSVPTGAVAVTGTTQNFVYTVNEGDNSISQFTVCAPPIDCFPLGGLVFDATVNTTGESIQSIVASPNGQFLYVSDLSTGAILGFTVDPGTGNLNPLASAFQAGTNPTSLAIDPKSQFLYVSDSGDNAISAFTVQANGALAPIGQELQVQGNSPNVVLVDPGGQFLYVSDQGSSLQETYVIGPAGGLALASSAAERAGGLSLAVTAPVTVTIGNEYFYATNTNSPAASGISGASLDFTNGAVGAVTPTNSIETLPYAIVADPLDQHVFVSNGTASNSSETEFNVVQATGALVNAIPAQGFVPLTTLGNAEAIDPSGNFLYVSDINTGAIYLCTLTNGIIGNSCPKAASVTVAVGLAVSPTGQYLYVLGTDDNGNVEVSVFSIDPNSGTLSAPPETGTPYPTGNNSGGVSLGVNEQIAVDPSGKFVVVNNGSTNLFTVFSVDGNGGMVKLADQVVQGRPQSLIFDATGSHLYEVEGGTTAVATYQFDPNTGALTFSAYAQVNNIPGDAAIDATGQYLIEIAVADDANLTGSVELFPISATDGTLGAALSTTILGFNTSSITAVAANVTAGSPSVTLIANQLTFPATTINTSTADMSVTLHNFGTGPLLIASILINSGANPGDFTFDTDGSTCFAQGIIPAGGTCIISVFFTPTAAGNRSATLTVTDNAFPATQGLPLFGSGTNPGPSFTANPNALAFPSTTEGTPSAALTSTVTNFGGAPLIFTSLTIAGANPGDFALDPAGTTCSTQVPVAAGGSCVLSVIFTPTATGARAATLSLVDNATPAIQMLSLTGTGAGPQGGDFTITTPDKPTTIIAGQPTIIVVTITPGPGLQNPITFTAPGPLPTGLCVVYPQPDPAIVTAPQTFTFHITTTPRSTGVAPGPVTSIRPPVWPLFLRSMEFLTMFLVLLCLLWGYKTYAGQRLATGFTTRRWAVLGATSLLVLATISFGGCGGGGANDLASVVPSTPPGVYQITITATTAGGITHSVSGTVQVQ